MRACLAAVGSVLVVVGTAYGDVSDNPEDGRLTVEASVGNAVELSVPPVLDLTSAQRIALSQNPTLQASDARIRQARQRVRQATSIYFPQVGGQVTASKTNFSENQIQGARRQVIGQGVQGVQGTLQRALQSAISGSGATTSPFSLIVPLATTTLQTVRALDVDDSSEAYTAQIQATWLLFDGFEREFNVRAARLGVEQSEAALHESRRLLLAAVAGAFYQAQLARENIAIAQADLEFNERLLKEAEARRRVGTGPLSDVLNFQVQANQARQRGIEQRRIFALSLLGLAELMGVPESALPPDQDLAPLDAEIAEELVLPDVRPLLDYAAESRPDLNIFAYAVAQSGAQAKARRGPFYPQVAASWSTDAFRTSGLGFSSNDFTTTIGMSVTYTFFAGGRNRAALLEAKEVKAEAEWNLASAEIQVAREVREAIENLRAAQASLKLQRENAELVHRNRDLVEKGYLVGQESLVRLTQADRDYINARGLLAQALVSLRAAWHDLRTATGQSIVAAEHW